MKTTMIRTLQIGVSLIVLTVAGVAVMAILGFIEQDSAMTIATNVSAVIGVCLVSAIVLTALFGGTDSDRD